MSNSQSEIWKPIPSLHGLYEASNFGRIRCVDRFVEGYSARGKRPILIHRKGQIMRCSSKCRGYLGVSISINRAEACKVVHLLILEAFKGSRPLGMQGCHNNGIKNDNRIDNLRWDTPLENQADIERHGTRCKGEMIASSKLTPEAVLLIRSGMKRSDAIKAFGIGPTQFYRVKRGESWNHL